MNLHVAADTLLILFAAFQVIAIGLLADLVTRVDAGSATSCRPPASESQVDRRAAARARRGDAVEHALVARHRRRPSRTRARRSAGPAAPIASASSGDVAQQLDRGLELGEARCTESRRRCGARARRAPRTAAARAPGRRCANASVSTIAKLSKYDGCTSASAPASAPLRVGSSTKPVTTMSDRAGIVDQQLAEQHELEVARIPLLVRDEVVDQLGRALRGVDPADVEQVRRVAEPEPAPERVGVAGLRPSRRRCRRLRRAARRGTGRARDRPPPA